MKKPQLNNKFRGLCSGNLFMRFNVNVYLIALFTYLSIGLNAQIKAVDIIGNYMIPSKDGAIQIFEKGGKYYGKIVLYKDPNKLDINNPKKENQGRKILGLCILNDFSFDGEKWENGTIYDPKNGKTYSCKITMNVTGDLNIRGFIGVSIIGRTEVFTKLKS